MWTAVSVSPSPVSSSSPSGESTVSYRVVSVLVIVASQRRRARRCDVQHEGAARLPGRPRRARPRGGGRALLPALACAGARCRGGRGDRCRTRPSDRAPAGRRARPTRRARPLPAASRPGRRHGPHRRRAGRRPAPGAADTATSRLRVPRATDGFELAVRRSSASRSRSPPRAAQGAARGPLRTPARSSPKARSRTSSRRRRRSPRWTRSSCACRASRATRCARSPAPCSTGNSTSARAPSVPPRRARSSS